MSGGVAMKCELRPVPVRSYLYPEYPTRQDVQLNPDILKALPERWKAKPAVYAALALTLSTGLFGCAEHQNTSPSEPSDNLARQQASITENSSNRPVMRIALQIPIFEHGAGQGSYGCDSVAPPVFLSEEEARQVIREEAEARGVHFTGTLAIEGDQFPETSLLPEEGKPLGTWKGMLELDGYDPDLGIGFEFVSSSDVESWAPEGERSGILDVWNMKDTAERLSQVVQNTAVFYDPGADYEAVKFNWHSENDDYKTRLAQYTAEQKEIMIEELREQVRDFLAWLAAEGVI
jgi:hypothetical protein